MPHPKRICFVTGTRAEFGLMRSTLRAIGKQPGLHLQLIVTGMHLHKRHGRTIDVIREEGWPIDVVLPWRAGDGSPTAQARATGTAMAAMSKTFESLRSDVVLVVGDRVEAFAAASAAAIGQRVVAHVHGGDRAEGQVDDSIRHAITKLAHIHFTASPGSAKRIGRLGEDNWRIHNVGAPGLDGITRDAAPWSVLHAAPPFNDLARRRFALVLLHPVTSDIAIEEHRAGLLLDGLREAGVEQAVVLMPNSDPGHIGISLCWLRRRQAFSHFVSNLPRSEFIGLMRNCAVMVGNSSAGIIEAGALGTPVVNIGDRQAGRERGGNVVDVPYDRLRIARAVRAAVRKGRSTRADKTHPYGGGNAGQRIAEALARVAIDQRLIRKLITY